MQLQLLTLMDNYIYWENKYTNKKKCRIVIAVSGEKNIIFRLIQVLICNVQKEAEIFMACLSKHKKQIWLR